MALADQVHQAADEQPEQGYHPVDRQVHLDHQVVQPGHDQDRDVLVEVLHGDRVAGAHQDVAAVLEQGVHRHDEEAGQAADDDQQRHGQPDFVNEVHGQHDQPHGNAKRDDANRFSQGDEFGGGYGADCNAGGNGALQHGGLGQPEVERDFD